MNIYEISMKSYNLKKMKHFYTNILQMELIVEEEHIFSVMAGTTRLNFERDFQQPYYHLCLRTNESYFDKMYEILKGMNILLENEAGETSLFWKGKQMYFTDPDGNVLEILERDYHYKGAVPFGWFDIGEIGIPSSSVKDFRHELAPLVPDQIKEIKSENFAFYGDEQGVFVLVREGRCWYPTQRPASIHPLKITISGERSLNWNHPTLPYSIKIKPI